MTEYRTSPDKIPDEDLRAIRAVLGRYVTRTPDRNHPGWFMYWGSKEAVTLSVLLDAIERGDASPVTDLALRTFDGYQHEAARTGMDWDGKPFDEHRMLIAMGLGGEAGEVLEIIKKEVGHGRARDPEHMLEELGDTLWYLAEEARIHGFRLSEVAEYNVRKLRERYPDGFKELG